MNELKKRLSVLILVAAIGLMTGLPAKSRSPIKDEGQAKLMQQVNAGQKSNQLTIKEAKKLRKDLANVARKKIKMLAKNNGKLNVTDTAKLKDDINKISENMQKLELEKRVQSH